MSRPPNSPGPDATRSAGDAGRREVITLLFTDLVGSTQLKEDLGNVEALRLIREHHAVVRTLLREYAGGREVSTSGDSFFLAFHRPSDAVAFALRLQTRLDRWNEANSRKVLDRIGLHAGEVTVEEDGQGGIHDLHGLEVDKAARVMSVGRENQILVTRFAFDNARASLKGQTVAEVDQIQWANHGLYELKGVVDPVEICEVATGLRQLSAPGDSEKARRSSAGEGIGTEGVLPAGWRRWLAGTRISRRLALLGAVLTACAGVFGLALLRPVVDLSYDLAYLFRPDSPPPDAVIVRMDPEAEKELGQPSDHVWDRRVHARLIDRLRVLGAKVVVMDVWFDGTNEPAGDAALVRAATAYTNLVVAGVVHNDVVHGHQQESIGEPFPELEAVAHWGLSFFPYPLDSIVREPHPGRGDKPHVAVEAARLVRGDPRLQPVGPWLNYYGPAGTIGSVGYAAVLAATDDDKRFEGKVVFVGAVNLNQVGTTGGRLNDEAGTPFMLFPRWSGQRTPGVEVVATATMNFVRGEWLRRLPPLVEVLLLLLAGAVAGFGLSRFRPLPALVVAVALGVGVGLTACLLVWRTHVWFPWLVFCLLQVPVALAWSALAWANGTPAGRGRGRTPGKSVKLA